MRHAPLVLVLAAVAGVALFDWSEHRQTRRKLDELAAAVTPAAPAAAPAPAPAPAVAALPTAPAPREVSAATPRSPRYVIEPPDSLVIQVVLRDAKTDRTKQLPVQDISGQFLVRIDGTVGLGYWGSLVVSGLTIDQTQDTIRRLVAGNDALRNAGIRAEDVVVIVDVLAANSKRYYVVTTGGRADDRAYVFPATGNETVLDAMAQMGNLSAGATPVSVTRKTPDGWRVLPVNWEGITRHGVSDTNYQIRPGDRVVVALAN